MTVEVEKHTAFEHISIIDAIRKINKLKSVVPRVLFIVNSKYCIKGSLTDGDIRRGLLKFKNLNYSINKVMNQNFKYLDEHKITVNQIKKLREQDLLLVPILNKKKQIIDIFSLKDYKSKIPIEAFILAGGEGKRLLPLTEKLPKSLLKVGSKPILEHNIDWLSKFGITNFYISVNYLKNQIRNYFRNDNRKSVYIKFIEEPKSLGTIGSLSLIKSIKHKYILVTNSDILSNIDIESFYLTAVESNADMVVATLPYNYNLPYATLELNGTKVCSLKEKPTITYYLNAGIYLINQNAFNLIPPNKFYNATDLMDSVIKNRLKLISFPILGYWLDIGRLEDYEKAQRDIKFLNFN